MSMVPARPLRADAQRNRNAILHAAREVFETEGILAPIDSIAIRAGVGNATLYRNFATREDLLVAVMHDGLTELVDQSSDLEAMPSPEAALREWLFRVAWQLRRWHDLPTLIASAMGTTQSPLHAVCVQLTARTDVLLQRARANGSASPSVEVQEVFELVLAASWAVDRFADDAARAHERIALATTGVFTWTHPATTRRAP